MTVPFTLASDPPMPTPQYRVAILDLHHGSTWFFYCACGDVGPARDRGAAAFYDWEDHRMRCVLRPLDGEESR